MFHRRRIPRSTFYRVIPLKLAIDTLTSQPWANDCQKLVVSKYPAAKALGWLLEYAPSRMTGTGACVFGEFTTATSSQPWRNYRLKCKDLLHKG